MGLDNILGGKMMGVTKTNRHSDPTAYKAIREVEKERKNVRVQKLLFAIFSICSLSGFEVQGPIILKDKKTGKVWR